MTVLALVCEDGLDTPEESPGRQLVAGLCRNPTAIADLAAGSDQLVLVLHRDDFELSLLQTAMRAAGIDPLGCQIVDLPEGGDLEGHRFRTTLAGARARAAAFTGSEPGHARPAFPKKLSRRSLFGIPKPEYEAVPLVDHGVCAAGDGCHACADVCPQDAYTWSDGRILFSKDACIPCGRCLTTCPTAAISSPAADPDGIWAQIQALTETSPRPIGIRFVCQRRTVLSEHPDWHDVEVPCTAMVPGTWILGALLAGAAGATAVPCTDAGCPLAQDDVTNASAGFARSALEAVGLDPGLVPLAAQDITLSPIGRVELEDPFDVHAPPLVVGALAAATATPKLSITHPGAPIGDVEIDAAACTLCTMCSQTCPTGALEHDSEGDRILLSFDPTLCTACSQCLSVCPEIARGAIKLENRVDLGSLRLGRRTLNSGETVVCESCGKAIAPAPMMDRISELLGEEHAATSALLARLCLDCRGVG